MFDIKIECTRAKVSREGRRQSWLASCKRVGRDSGELLCPTPLVEGGRSGTSVGFGTRQRC